MAGREVRDEEARNIPVKNAHVKPEKQQIAEVSLILIDLFILNLPFLLHIYFNIKDRENQHIK
jgi:hypothetical protein